MEFVNNPVVVDASWKTEFMDALIAAANLEGWTTIRNAYDDGTYTRWVLESPDEKFYAIFWCHTSALNSTHTTSNTTGFGALNLTLAETYNTSTEEFNGVSIVSGNNFIADATTETYNNVFTIASLITAGTGGPGFVAFGAEYGTIPSTNVVIMDNYAISISGNVICLAIRTKVLSGSTGISRTFIYAGNINSKVIDKATNDPNTAHLFNFYVKVSGTAGGSGYAGAFRNTGGPVRSAMNGGAITHRWDCTIKTGLQDRATDTSSTTWDLWQGSVGPSVDSFSVFRRNGTTISPNFGYYRGDLFSTVGGVEGAVYGDEITVDTDTYFCTAVNTPTNITNFTHSTIKIWIRKS